MAKRKNLPAKSGSDVPAYLKTRQEDLGVDSIEPQDIVIPRMKICQGQSGIKDIIKINDGQFYNSVTNDVYGERVSFFVLLHWKSTVWFTDDFKLRGIIYKDAETKEEVHFGQDIEACIKNIEKDPGINAHNYFIIGERELSDAVKNNDFPLPVVYSCQSAAVKSARQLNGKLKTNAVSRGIPIYGQLIQASSIKEKFEKGSAFMPVFEYGRYANQNEFKFLSELHDKCKLLQKRQDVQESSVKVQDDDEEGDVFEQEARKREAEKKAGKKRRNHF